MHRSPMVLCRWIVAVLGLGLALGSMPAPVSAQVPSVLVASDTLYEVQLADGSTIIGRIVAVTGDDLTLETEAGVRVQVTRSQIRSMRPLRGRVQDGQVWTEDPHATRLFFGPTGRSLARGEGYFGVFELFFPFLTVGVTDALLLTGGTPIIPGAMGEFAYVGPKLRVVDAGRVQVATGFLAGLFDGGTAGIAYGVGTWGSHDNALTVGAGWGFWAGDGDSGMSREPLMMVGGEARAGRRAKLITENYFVFGEGSGVISGGVRFWGERLSADAGLAALIGDDSGCCLPMVNFVYSFGRQR